MKSPREISPKRPAIVLISILFVVALFFLAKLFLFDRTKTTDPDQYSWQENADKQGKAVEPPLPTIDPKKNDLAPPPDYEAVSATEATSCQRIAKEIGNFFSHLEQQEYIAAYELKEPMHEKFTNLTSKLLNNPPIISQETEDLFTVLKNTAHFYRILGHKDLSLIKDILAYEQNDIEHLMTIFYENFLTQGDCPQDSAKIEMPLNQLYEYAGFFLNTLGGQSYLFRRDSRLRVLAKYYCTLILDQASQKGLNRHNIDELYSVDSIFKDMHEADSLENQDQYLAKLESIKTRLLNRAQ